MKLALIYPPTCDPTAPYLALPTLSAFLRTHGVEVVPIDANIEAYDRLLRQTPLTDLAHRVARRLMRLQRQKRLSHVEQLAYIALYQAQADAQTAPANIEDAVAVLRDRSGARFFDPAQYGNAVATVESALRLISAAYTPLTLTFLSYRTPFSLLTFKEIEADARPKRNPFHPYFLELCDDLARQQVNVVGISVAFPGQIQPAYALAFALRRHLPDVYITVGGPAMTQLLVCLPEEMRAKAITPFDSAVLFEGEQALLDLVRSIERGERPRGIIQGERAIDLSALPAPDFEGLPLDKYFAPALVLPYDPTRGCYWGKCAFCQYGLTESGTARYRERPTAQVVEHLQSLMARYGNRLFYFSHDSMSPNMALRVAQALQQANIECRWGTDMRPEAALTPETCQIIFAGGALSVALGIESGAPRVLKLINKGIRLDAMQTALTNLAAAGIAVEVMAFTDFPTETYPETLATLRLIDQFRDRIALFICGQFDLVAGARVAQSPQDYGLREIWHVDGDELQSGLFYAEQHPSKTDREREKIDAAIDQLATSWWLHRYPWAGSLSTAHTLLWYDRYGPDVFRRFAGVKTARTLAQESLEPQFHQTLEHEADIWQTLIYEQRRVTRRAYRELVVNHKDTRRNTKKI